MHEKTKELDQLRRLAEMLRQAAGSATDSSGGPRTGKGGPAVKKLQRGKPSDRVQDQPKR